MKEKIDRLTRYRNRLKDMIEAPVPPKHYGHESEYRLFLYRELQYVDSKIEALKKVA